MKNTFKPLFRIAFFALVFSFLSEYAEAQNLERIKLLFGTRCRPAANGQGCEGEKGTCLIVTFQQRVNFSNPGVAEISISKHGIVHWEIIEDSSPAEENENIFHIYEPKEVPAEICRELGYDRIILQPGKYRLDKSKNRLGIVDIKAEMR